MMKRLLITALAVTGIGTMALATDVNLDVQRSSDEMSEITVQPGELVEYQVKALLSDNMNEGLALLGFDLEFDGGPLSQADEPASGPAMAFARPDGLTNPAGYGGTEIGGRLVQVGGGQNTIKNGQLACVDNTDCPTGSTCDANLCTPVADFPVGLVITGVAEPMPEGSGPAVMATGSLTAPMAEGDYLLSIPLDSVFANVIKPGETGEVFYATEPAGVGTVTNLLIHVVAGGVPAQLTGADPTCDGSLWRNANNTIRLTFDGPITAPVAGEILIQELQAGGAVGADMSGDFTYTVEGDNVLRIDENGSILTHRTWVGISNTGGWTGVDTFKVDYQVQVGDADGNGRVLFDDVLLINSSVPCFADCAARHDIDGNTRVLFDDVLAANASVPSFPVTKPTEHTCDP